jgi:hypothetical protein
MKLDVLSVHQDDVGEKVGEFYSTPIFRWDHMVSRLREVRDAIFRVLSAHEDASLPQELSGLLDTGQYEICTDHILRRTTAADHIFRSTQDIPIGSLSLQQSRIKGLANTAGTFCETPANSRRLTIKEAIALAKQGAQILWRPNNEDYALEVL